MTDFQPAIFEPANNSFGGVEAAYLAAAPSFAPSTLGLFPPTTDSLGGTMTAAGSEYERTTTTLLDPATGYPVTLVRVWSVGAAPTAAPLVVNAYNADGSAYTGSIANLELPSGASSNSASEGAVSGIYQDTLTIVTQNVIPPLTKPWAQAPGAFANIIAGASTFTSGNGVVTFHNGSKEVDFSPGAAQFNLNPGETIIAQYSSH